MYTGFSSWAHVIAAVQAGVNLYYAAPMDARPIAVRCIVRGKHPRKVRVVPPYSGGDPFWADAGHLARFAKLDQQRERL